MRYLGTLHVPVRKARTLFDQIGLWLQIQEMHPRLRYTRMTFAERVAFRELYPFLTQPDMIAYDIGAYVGSYSRAMASLRNVRAVYAFEPLPDAFDDLSRRTRALQQVRCYNVALGNRDGMTTLYQSAYRASSSLLSMNALHRDEFPHTARTQERQVRTVCLDDLISQEQLLPPDFIKIDVQGYEDRVLQGAGQALQHARFCMLELSFYPLYEGSWVFDEMYHFMREQGFELVGLTGGVVGRSGRLLQMDGIFERVNRT